MNIPFVDLKKQYQILKGSIDQNIQKVLDHGFFVMGPEVQKCEEELSHFCGSPFVVSCASGTDALVMALMVAEIGPGDEVIVPAFSFIATAEAVVLVGATPVYVDIEPETFNIDVKKITAALTEKTKAIIPVSLYGQPADMEEINSIAQDRQIVVIEDAAQSFGADYKSNKSCNLSTLACTSFFPAKPLGCYGDGGAVFTNDPKLHKGLTEIRNHGQESRYYHTRVGINGRMDTLQCAILLAKLERYSQELENRQKAADFYSSRLEGVAGLSLPQVKNDRSSVWAQYTLRVSDREQFQKKLSEKGVPTAVHYPITMPDQPAYKNIGFCHDISESRKAANEVVSLPMHGDLDEETLTYIVEAIKG